MKVNIIKNFKPAINWANIVSFQTIMDSKTINSYSITADYFKDNSYFSFTGYYTEVAIH